MKTTAELCLVLDEISLELILL